MKKLVLSFAAICAAVSLNAQILTANNGTAFSTWSVADVDADTYVWGIFDLTSVGFAHAASLGECAVSFSYGDPDQTTAAALTPNNFMISPVMNLTGYTSATLEFDVTTLTDAGETWFAEHYAVYAASTIGGLASATPLLEETIPAAATVYSKTIDLSSMAGQSAVYIAFRHFNCTDQYGLVIDNVVVDGTLGLNENVISTSVYPNPANDVLNIVASEEIANVSIVGLDGKVVATSTTSTVNVADLNSGMYIYEVTTTSGKVSRDSFMKK